MERVRAGRDHDRAEPRRGDRRIEGRAQRLHRLRVPADRARAVDAGQAATRCGARCRGRCGCRRGSTPICALPARRRSWCCAAIRGSSPKTVLSREIGYRRRLGPTASIDLAAFYNTYDDLRTQEPTPPLGIPIVLSNLMEARTSGRRDLGATTSRPPPCGCTSGYTYLSEDFRLKPGSRDIRRTARRSTTIRRTRCGRRSNVNLPHDFEADAIFRFVDALPHPVVPRLRGADAALRLAARRDRALRRRRQPAARSSPGVRQPDAARGVSAQRLRPGDVAFLRAGPSTPPTGRLSGRGAAVLIALLAVARPIDLARPAQPRVRGQGGVPLQLHPVRRVAARSRCARASRSASAWPARIRSAACSSGRSRGSRRPSVRSPWKSLAAGRLAGAVPDAVRAAVAVGPHRRAAPRRRHGAGAHGRRVADGFSTPAA